MALKVNIDLKMENASLINEVFDELPTSPTPGQMVVVGGVPHIYTNIEGSYGWWVMNQKQMYHIHEQTSLSKQWTIEHNMGTTDFIYHIYDEAGNVVLANINHIDANSCYVNLSSSIKGRMIIFGASNHHAGYMPSTLGNTSESITYGTEEPDDNITSDIYIQLN